MASALFVDNIFVAPSTPVGIPNDNPWKTDDPWSNTPAKANRNEVAKKTTPADSPLLLSSSVWTPLKQEDDNEKQSWNISKNNNAMANNAPKLPNLWLLPPETISFQDDYEDDVSVLNDDPDEDDAAILPQPTYDVLANIFDELYKDESEIEEDEEDAFDVTREFPDGACAA